MSLLLAALVGTGTLSAAWAGWRLSRQLLLFLPSIPLPSAPTVPSRGKNPPFPWDKFHWKSIQSGFRQRRDDSRIREVFPQALGMAIQALKTGQTFPQALAYLSQECAPPLRQELAQVCSEMGLGASAEEALSHLTQRRVQVREFSQFLESYRISRTTGANLGQLLQVLLEGMEEKNRLLRKMEAMTAQARLSGLLMGLLPLLLVGLLALMDPVLLQPLFTQKAGWGLLLLSLFLEGIGFLWIRQLLRLEV